MSPVCICVYFWLRLLFLTCVRLDMCTFSSADCVAALRERVGFCSVLFVCVCCLVPPTGMKSTTCSLCVITKSYALPCSLDDATQAQLGVTTLIHNIHSGVSSASYLCSYEKFTENGSLTQLFIQKASLPWLQQISWLLHFALVRVLRENGRSAVSQQGVIKIFILFTFKELSCRPFLCTGFGLSA